MEFSISSLYAACQSDASGLEKASLYDMGSSSLLRLHHLSLLNEKCIYPSGIVSMACIYALEFFSELFLVNLDMHVDLHGVFSGGLSASSSTCGRQAVCMHCASLLSMCREDLYWRLQL